MRLTKTLPLAATALLALPAAAAAKDRNHDGLPDGWEKAHHLSLTVNQANRDQDHDGLRNRSEFRHGTNPRAADTDHDGLNDGAEVETGNNPRKDDTDGDGRDDGQENAGTVASFTGGVLTITLADGSTLKGTVTDATKVKCERGDAAADDQGDDQGEDTARAARDGGDDNGDNGEGDDDANANSAPCTIAAGDPVHEASVTTTSTGLAFKEVELAK